jgi:hypothetical protein
LRAATLGFHQMGCINYAQDAFQGIDAGQSLHPSTYACAARSIAKVDASFTIGLRR